MLECLTYNESLVNLNLSSFEGLHRNRIGPKGVFPLKEALAVNKTLTILNLGGNCIGNEGVSYICQGLQHNESLIELSLHSSDINSHGATLLKTTLPKTNIQYLNLSKNPLGNAGIEKIAFLLTANRMKIRELNVSDCKFNYMGAAPLY